jgi:glucose/arabinose dehydrogenase
MSDDEINLIEPGFNGGWNKIVGIHKVPKNFEVQRELSDVLVDFDGKGKYMAPKFVWNKTIAPTALKFLNSVHLGEEYENDLLVASYNSGDIYDFNLDRNRTHLVLDNPVSDRLGKKSEFGDLIFASDLGKITDIEVGPDGNLYVLSKFQDAPTIFKISPINDN